jgi:hypothetical protein
MTTAMISTPAEKYLEAVQRGLADLPAEDIEEVLQDLAAHIAELGEGNPEASLGSPDAFIAEFRASAGLDSVGARSSTYLARREVGGDHHHCRRGDGTNDIWGHDGHDTHALRCHMISRATEAGVTPASVVSLGNGVSRRMASHPGPLSARDRPATRNRSRQPGRRSPGS